MASTRAPSPPRRSPKRVREMRVVFNSRTPWKGPMAFRPEALRSGRRARPLPYERARKLPEFGEPEGKFARASTLSAGLGRRRSSSWSAWPMPSRSPSCRESTARPTCWPGSPTPKSCRRRRRGRCRGLRRRGRRGGTGARRRSAGLSGRRRRGQHGVDHVDVGAVRGVGHTSLASLTLMSLPLPTIDVHRTAVLVGILPCTSLGPRYPSTMW